MPKNVKTNFGQNPANFGHFPPYSFILGHFPSKFFGHFPAKKFGHLPARYFGLNHVSLFMPKNAKTNFGQNPANFGHFPPYSFVLGHFPSKFFGHFPAKNFGHLPARYFGLNHVIRRNYTNGEYTKQNSYNGSIGNALASNCSNGIIIEKLALAEHFYGFLFLKERNKHNLKWENDGMLIKACGCCWARWQ